MKKEILVSVLFVVFLIYWIGSSHFEAATYNRLTKSKVGTWDAMFVQLRVGDEQNQINGLEGRLYKLERAVFKK